MGTGGQRVTSDQVEVIRTLRKPLQREQLAILICDGWPSLGFVLRCFGYHIVTFIISKNDLTSSIKE